MSKTRLVIYTFLISLILLVSFVRAEDSLELIDMESEESCHTDSDCISLYEHCSPESHLWVHKDVFPIYPREFLGVVALVISIALCNAAGIGGGEIIVAVLIVFFEFSTKSSAVLSNVWIFTASFARFVLNYKQKHPEKKATSVDYDIVTLMLPVVLLGSFVGVQLNIIVPNAVLLLILMLLLIFLSIKTTIKGVRMFREETKAKRKYQVQVIAEVSENNEGSNEDGVELDNVRPKNKFESEASFISLNESSQYLSPMLNEYKAKDNGLWKDMNSSSLLQSGSNLKSMFKPDPKNKSVCFMDNWESVMIKSLDGSQTRILKQVKQQERTHVQCGKLFPIIVLFLILSMVSFLRESHREGSSFNIERCSPQDWLLLSTFLVIGTLITIIWIWKLKAIYNQKLSVGYKFTSGDIKWENSIIMKMLFTALIGGILSGMVGLGGGVIFNPLLLEFGVNPMVSSATGMYMVMLATLSSSILFMMEGRMMFAFAIYLGFFMWIATVMGIKSVDKAVRKYGRPSLLVIILAGVIIVGTVITPALSIAQVKADYEKGENLFKFNSYC